MPEDTICALSTSPVNSPIALIRLSGPLSPGVIKSIFTGAEKIRPRHAVYGTIFDIDDLVDDVILIFYKAPSSFTGEDMAEIMCHGNPLVVNRILRLLNRLKVRMAEPGEFCKRAFLNGKIDLTEAEAINNIITARSQWAVESAIRQMHGSLKNSIHAIRDRLILLKGDVESSIDFSDEDMEFVSSKEMLNQLDSIEGLIIDVFKRCRIGEKLSRGIDVPIVGKPNVGKSSILNLILNFDRAIVSSIPGTTRDLIQESIQFAGMHVNLIDTAGIDIPSSEIEEKGIALSHKKIQESSVVIMVMDAASGLHEADRKIIEKIKDKAKIFIANKIDLTDLKAAEELGEMIGDPVIPFSAKTGYGYEKLESELTRIISKDFVEYKDSYVSDIRIISILENSINLLTNLKNIVSKDHPPEIVAFELQTLIDSLSEITGEITPDDILNSIFDRFCIGK